MLARIQIRIAPSARDIVRNVASSLKIFDYASCGLLIINVNVGECSDIVKENNCGIVADDSDPEK